MLIIAKVIDDKTIIVAICLDTDYITRVKDLVQDTEFDLDAPLSDDDE